MTIDTMGASDAATMPKPSRRICGDVARCLNATALSMKSKTHWHRAQADRERRIG